MAKEDAKQAVEDETTEATPAAEQTESEEQTTVEESEAGSDEPTNEDTTGGSEQIDEKPSSPRLEKRFQKMSNKIKELSSAQAPQLEYQAPQFDQYGNIPLQNNEYYPETVDPIRQAEALTDIKLQQFRAEQQMKERVETLDRDIDYVERKHPELDETSDKYDAKLAEKVASMYEKLSTKSPDIRLRDVVEDVMDLADRQSTRESAQTSARVAKQQSETAVKSESDVKPSGKDIKDMSLEELEANIGFHN